MSLEQLNTIDVVRHFLEGRQAVAFGVAANKQERYRWVQKKRVKHRYTLLGKPEKGLVTRYLMEVTRYSHAQSKRLIQPLLKSRVFTRMIAVSTLTTVS